MFRNTAKLLKVFAWIAAIAVAAAGWAYFIWEAATNYSYYGYFGGVPLGHFATDLGIAIGATFLGWLIGALIFGAARRVECLQKMAQEVRLQRMMFEALLYRWDVKNPPSVPEKEEKPIEKVCPCCNNRQETELKYCRLCGAEMIYAR